MPTMRNSLRCPRCSASVLETRGHEGVEIDICARCSGLWCEAGDWNEAVLGSLPEDAPLAIAVDATGADVSPSLAQPVLLGAASAACPACHVPLTPIGVSGISGLQIDLCLTCRGVWFDHREWNYLAALRSWIIQRPRLERETTWGEWAFQFILRLPIEFNIRPHRTPVVTLAIILVCMLVELAFDFGTIREQQLIGFAAQGMESLRFENWFQLVTYQFIHAGWVHLVGNLYLLYILGDNVEDVLGRFRYLMFYLVCGIAAAVAQALVAPGLPLVGASGSISGVIAAYLVLFRRARLTFMFMFWQFKPPAIVWIGTWLLINIGAVLVLDNEIMNQVAWMAHLGGFVAGLVLIVPFRSALIEGSPLLYLIDRRQIQA